MCVRLLSEGALHLISSRSEMLASHLEASKRGLINWRQCACLWNRGCVPVAENGDGMTCFRNRSLSFSLPLLYSVHFSHLCLSLSQLLLSACLSHFLGAYYSDVPLPLCGGDACLTVSLSVMWNKLGVGRGALWHLTKNCYCEWLFRVLPFMSTDM